jgi:diaminopimelate epimerase
MIEFTKMSGAGNDFIFLGPRYSHLRDRASQLARYLCRRRLSVGADGLVMVDTSGGNPFMYYLNADGSEASFCGNGARCLVLFCAAKGIASGKIQFRSSSGTHTGEEVSRGVRVSMKPPSLVKEMDLRASGRDHRIFLVDAGVPHAVLLTDCIDTIDVTGLGRELRNHPVFGKQGANVDFLDASGQEPYPIRTYERGVERETLACGSGCVAAAKVLRLQGLGGRAVDFRVASGDHLTVELPSGGQTEEAHLTGSARITFEGRVEIEENSDV